MLNVLHLLMISQFVLMLQWYNLNSICFAVGIGVTLKYDDSYYYSTSMSDMEGPPYYENLTNIYETNKQLIAGLAKTEDDRPVVQQPNKNTKRNGATEKAITSVYKYRPLSPLDLLRLTETQITAELQNYNFHKSEVGGLKHLIMKHGGQPRRTLILSTWRSGSTFLGQIINSVPGNFYHDEPLHRFGLIQIRGPPYAVKAVNVLKSLFKCKYTGMETFLNYAKLKAPFLISRNKRLWDKCVTYRNRRELCFNGTFIGKICKLFPFQSMKVLRLRLQLIEDILKDARMNVRVVLLVRDPRAVMSSRKSAAKFCKTVDCKQCDRLCADMVSDYKAGVRLMYKFPKRIMFLRFEDLSLKPGSTIKKLFRFLKIEVSPSVDQFLLNHTTGIKKDGHSTYRVSKFATTRWKKVLDFAYVDALQQSCKEAMTLWKYRLVHDAVDMKKFTSKEYYKVTYGDIEFTNVTSEIQ